ncbi:hypothetical protein FRC18_000541 [Serendipita sp. 400]|nr:hypothetical protein FRC18_000541 [Serendipita sp. 400]
MSGHVQDQSWSRFDQSPPLGPVGQEDREVGIGDDNGGKLGKSRTGSRLMVVLNKLWYLHLEESSSVECARFLSRISCPSLQTLVICTTEPISSAWGTGDRAGQRSNRPFNTLSSVFERTTQLQLSFTDSGCFTVIGRPGETSWDHPRYSPRWWQGTGSEKRNTGPGWSISYKRGSSYLYSNVISGQLRQFLQSLEVAGVRYEQIELVDLAGQCDFEDEFYRELLARCFCVRRLHIRPWPKFVTNGSGVFGALGGFASMANMLGRFDGQTGMRVLRNVVGRNMCPELEQVYLMQFTSPAWELADWVEKRSRRRGRNKKGAGLKRIVVDVFHDLEESTDRTRWMEDASVLDGKSQSRIEDALGMQQSHDRRDNPPEGDGDVGSNGDEYGLVWRNSQRERFIAAQKSKNERPKFSRVRHPFMFPFAYDPFAYEH